MSGLFSRMPKYDATFKMRLLNDSFRRMETLKLYKEVLKFTKLFTWQDETSGVMWGDLIKLSARQEIESSREEKDPQILAQALVNARMALDEMQEKFHQQQLKVQQEFTNHVNSTRTDRAVDANSSDRRIRTPIEIMEEREMMKKMGFDPNIGKHHVGAVNYDDIPIIHGTTTNIPILTPNGVWTDDSKK